MQPALPPDTAELASALIAQGSRFARSASRRVGSHHSLVALRVLSNLSQDGGLRIGELASREGVSQPAMTATVNRLETDGLVARGADAADARAAIVTITPTGVAELADFRSRAAAQVRPALETLGAAQLAVLAEAAELLARLTDQLNDRPTHDPRGDSA